MVSTPEGLTENSPLSPGPSMTVKNPSAMITLHQFSEVLNTKINTAVHRLGAAHQNSRQLDQLVCCGPVYQRGEDVQE